MQFILGFPALQGLYRFSSLQLYTSSYIATYDANSHKAKLQAGNLINLRSNYCKQVYIIRLLYFEKVSTLS